MNNNLKSGKIEAPLWVEKIFHRCASSYLGTDGVLVTSVYSDGSVKDATPMVADLGDLLPFAKYFNLEECIPDQITAAEQYLEHGLFKFNGKVELFFNHDWLLGLLDLYRQTGQPRYLELAELGGMEIGKNYFVADLLVVERSSGLSTKSLLGECSPFNGGYIELWLELYKYTQNKVYIDFAERLGKGWVSTHEFEKNGVFCRCFSARSSLLNSLLASRATLKSRLFKDNTNLVWSLLDLYKVTKAEYWFKALCRWLKGFELHFWNQGKVALMLNMKLQPYNFSLKAAFSSLDLLCDLAHAGIERERCLQLAVSIADTWMDECWPNGLFPETLGGSEDHLDANVDMVVALYKLSYLLSRADYKQAADKTSDAILKTHETENGFCLSVDCNGNIVDDEIKVKYQGLLAKLAILPEDITQVYENQDIFDLLRDR